MNYHGYRRATEDVDLVWLRSPESETALCRALEEVEAQHIGADIDPATRLERTYPVTTQFVQRTHLMMLWTKYGFLDLFDSCQGIRPSTRIVVRQLCDRQGAAVRVTGMATPDQAGVGATKGPARLGQPPGDARPAYAGNAARNGRMMPGSLRGITAASTCARTVASLR